MILLIVFLLILLKYSDRCFFEHLGSSDKISPLGRKISLTALITRYAQCSKGVSTQPFPQLIELVLLHCFYLVYDMRFILHLKDRSGDAEIGSQKFYISG